MENNFEKIGVSIYRKENSLTPEECDIIYNYTYANTNHPVEDPKVVPWDLEKSNTIYYQNIRDRQILDIINKYKTETAAELSKIFNETVYPHLTTVVLWKPGQSMGRHVDDGMKSETHREMLKMRKYTSVSYMNDNYKGGHTFIRNDGKDEPDFRTNAMYSMPNPYFEDYISIPKKGATVLFRGDDTNAHGVSLLEEGTRVILSTWFTDEARYQEPLL